MWQQVRNLIGLSGSFEPNYHTTKKQRLPQLSSELYDLVLDMNWPLVIQHCQDHPQDVLYQDPDTRETPLYLACQWSPPLNVLQALIQANPMALQMTAKEHRDLPLHVLCRYGNSVSLEALQLLAREYPAGASHPTKHGKSTLQILWAFARPNALKEEQSAALSSEEAEKVQQFWDKMQVLVEAVATSRQQSWPIRPKYYADSSSDDESPLSNNGQKLYHVHAVVSLGALGCPCPVLEYICNLYPDQLSQRDESGQLPLHLAVGPSQWSSTGGKRIYKPREQDIIRVLLERYPQAANQRLFSVWDYYDPSNGKQRASILTSNSNTTQLSSVKMDREGRYPLHIALAHRHSWESGVKELFQKAPDILSIRDPVTQLLPFQLAAIPVRDNLPVDLTTIFRLLRHQPELLESANNSTDDTIPGSEPSRELGMSPYEHNSILQLKETEEKQKLDSSWSISAAVGRGISWWKPPRSSSASQPAIKG